jgi:hypothetical protein
MHRRHRPALKDLRERRPVCIVQPRGLSGRLAIDQAFGPVGRMVLVSAMAVSKWPAA